MKLQMFPVVFIGFSLMAAVANAQNASSPLEPVSFAQRTCSPSDDVYFKAGMTEVSGGTCTWAAALNDSTMSLTTHFEDPTIAYVTALCNFNGVNGDQITEVTGAKSASISEVSGRRTPVIGFTLKKSGTDANSNILFRLNDNMTRTDGTITIGNAQYSEGTNISCKFTIHRG